MCKYCKENSEFLFTDGDWEIQIVEGIAVKRLLEIYFNNCCGPEGGEGMVDIPLEYCPKCGRNLG